MKKVLYFIIVLMQTGCTRTIKTDINGVDNSYNNRSIVLMRSYVHFPEDGPIRIMETEWNKRNENAIFTTAFKNLGGFGTHKDYQKMQVYSLEPGQYDLQIIHFHGRGFFDSTIGGGLYNIKFRKGEVSFQVGPGEVVYLGDILCKPGENLAKLEVKDNYHVAQEYILNAYPSLLPKLKKNLMSLSKPLG